jgi:hypothetical protein
VTVGTARSEAETLDVTASAGAVTATSLTSAATLTIRATGGALLVDTATSQGTGADLVIRATDVRAALAHARR